MIDHLSAEPAGRSEGFGLGDHHQGEHVSRPHALGSRGTDGVALGADRTAVAGIFDVAAGVEGAVPMQECCADLEVAIGRISIIPGPPGGLENGVPLGILGGREGHSAPGFQDLG